MNSLSTQSKDKILENGSLSLLSANIHINCKKRAKKKNNANALTKIYGVRLVIHVDTTNVDTLCNCLSYVFNLLLKIA